MKLKRLFASQTFRILFLWIPLLMVCMYIHADPAGRLILLGSGAAGFQMATVTIAVLSQTPDVTRYSVIASADGDTGGTITVSCGANPTVILTQILSQALTALSVWTVALTNITTLTLTKLTSTGSGNASVQLIVTVQRNR